MTKVVFINSTTINVITCDGEKFILTSHVSVSKVEQHKISKRLEASFKKRFSNDKLKMIYCVLMDMMTNEGFSFSCVGSDRSEERERIGKKIRELRENKDLEARHLALMAGIDAANLSRIENGKYSVGFDILTKIANVLDVKIDLV